MRRLSNIRMPMAGTPPSREVRLFPVRTRNLTGEFPLLVCIGFWWTNKVDDILQSHRRLIPPIAISNARARANTRMCTVPPRTVLPGHGSNPSPRQVRPGPSDKRNRNRIYAHFLRPKWVSIPLVGGASRVGRACSSDRSVVGPVMRHRD